ncbi:hypothetical protein NM208_g4076 [Fusarium decemcellulare]|uniref:Uncharacterized protein n=1 Tax=Fusarium decemcellulare TaxID=57161 RepID=A0ACC1SM02_9HYPO|nr:hypothetical protein NM208_g4076 [Fusarium decemcellulare]
MTPRIRDTDMLSPIRQGVGSVQNLSYLAISGVLDTPLQIYVREVLRDGHYQGSRPPIVLSDPASSSDLIVTGRSPDTGLQIYNPLHLEVVRVFDLTTLHHLSGILRSLPAEFSRRGNTCFVHKGLYGSQLPLPLQIARDICGSHLAGRKQLADPGLNTLTFTARHVLRLGARAGSFAETLANTSTLNTIDFPDMSEDEVEHDNEAMWALTHQLWRRAPGQLPSTWSPWQAWLFSENVRRTILVCNILLGVYTSLRRGYAIHSLCIEALPFDMRTQLWDAHSETSWLAAVSHVPEPSLVTFRQFVALKQPTLNDEPEFEKLLLLAFKEQDGLARIITGELEREELEYLATNPVCTETAVPADPTCRISWRGLQRMPNKLPSLPILSHLSKSSNNVENPEVRFHKLAQQRQSDSKDRREVLSTRYQQLILEFLRPTNLLLRGHARLNKLNQGHMWTTATSRPTGNGLSMVQRCLPRVLRRIIARLERKTSARHETLAFESTGPTKCEEVGGSDLAVSGTRCNFIASENEELPPIDKAIRSLAMDQAEPTDELSTIGHATSLPSSTNDKKQTAQSEKKLAEYYKWRSRMQGKLSILHQTLDPLVTLSLYNAKESPLYRLPDETLLILLRFSSQDELSFFFLRQTSRRFRRLIDGCEFRDHPFSLYEKYRPCKYLYAFEKRPPTRIFGDLGRHCFETSFGKRYRNLKMLGELATRLRKDQLCIECQEGFRRSYQAERSTVYEFAAQNTRDWVHCSSCAPHHPSSAFSPNEKQKKDAQRICVAKKGHIRLYQHGIIGWSDIEPYLTQPACEETTVIRLKTCRHPSHSRNCSWENPWPAALFHISKHSNGYLRLSCAVHTGSVFSFNNTKDAKFSAGEMRAAIRSFRADAAQFIVPERALGHLPEMEHLSRDFECLHFEEPRVPSTPVAASRVADVAANRVTPLPWRHISGQGSHTIHEKTWVCDIQTYTQYSPADSGLVATGTMH